MAARCPGRALHVALAIWHLVGVKKSVEVALSPARLRELGVDRHAGRRGLAALERAGMVAVVRRAGRAPWVTLLDAPHTEMAATVRGETR